MERSLDGAAGASEGGENEGRIYPCGGGYA